MSLSAFLSGNAVKAGNVKFVASRRFLSDEPELDERGKTGEMLACAREKSVLRTGEILACARVKSLLTQGRNPRCGEDEIRTADEIVHCAHGEKTFSNPPKACSLERGRNPC